MPSPSQRKTSPAPHAPSPLSPRSSWKLPMPKRSAFRKRHIIRTTASSYRAGDLSFPVDLDDAEVERVELTALAAQSAASVKEAKDDNGEEDEDTLASIISCSYPLCCLRVMPEQGAPVLWLMHLSAVICLFGAAVYFAEFESFYMWAGEAFWRFAVFFGVLLISPVLADLVVAAVLFSIRKGITVEQRRMHRELKRAMAFLFFVERMRCEAVRFIYFVLDTVTFALLFAQHPSTQQWNDGYSYTSYVLITLCVWAFGQVMTSYITQSISRSVNVRTLGDKIRTLLRNELTIWRISGASPPVGEARIFRLANDPYLIDDPATASELAKNIMSVTMSGDVRSPTRTDKRGRPLVYHLEFDSLREGRLMGAFMFTSMLRLARLREAQTQRIMQLVGTARTAKSLDKRLLPLDLAVPPLSDRELALKVDTMFSLRNRGVVPHYLRRFLVKNDVAVMLAQRSREQPDLPQVDLDVAWSFFDPEKLGLCSLKRARLLTLGHVQARKNMRATLKNAHDVVDKLRSVVSICINFFVFLCALAIFQLNVLEVWVGISSIILAFSFVFGATLRSIFDSLVFLFAVHAYDVGDKIKMGTDETVYYIRKIHLLSTTMARSDGAVIKFMNWNLLITPMINCRESEPLEVVVHFWVDAASLPSKADLELLQAELEVFLSQNRAAYSGACSVTVRDVDKPLQAKITVWWGFAYNDLDSGRVNRDKSKVLIFLLAAFKKRQVRVSGTGLGSVGLEKGAKVGLVSGALRVI